MKRAKIGNTNVPVDAPYWTGGKRSSRLRQSEKELYAKINLLQEQANFSESEDEIQSLYTEMDKLYVAIQLIMNFGDDEDLLLKAGVSYSDALYDGLFQEYYDTLEERNISVNRVATDCIAHVPDIHLSEDVVTSVILWWKDTVMLQNFYWNENTGEKSVLPADSIEAGIGATDDYDSLSARMVEGGMFYVYMIADRRLINTPNSMYKNAQQNITLDRLENIGVGLSRNVMLDNIKTGILRETNGKSASQVVQALQRGDAKIGEPITLIVAIIGAIVAIAGMVAKIVEARKTRIENETAKILSENNLNSIRPDHSDFPFGDSDGDGKADLPGVMNSLGNIGGIPILPIALLGGAILLFK